MCCFGLVGGWEVSAVVGAERALSSREKTFVFVQHASLFMRGTGMGLDCIDFFHTAWFSSGNGRGMRRAEAVVGWWGDSGREGEEKALPDLAHFAPIAAH